MWRISTNNHFTDNLGNLYHIHMTDHARGDKIKVCDRLCRFIFDTTITEPDKTLTGWFEVELGDKLYIMYLVDRRCPLFAVLDVESKAQYLRNFLAFTRNGKHITIEHFGPFGWSKSRELDIFGHVREERTKAKEKVERLEEERRRLEEQIKILEDGDPELSRENLEKFKRWQTRWKQTENEKAIMEMVTKIITKIGELAVRQVALETAVKAGKDVAEIIAKLTTKVGVEVGVKKITVLGFVVGLGFSTWRSLHGDFAGAALEIASGTASLVPGVGTAVSLGIDAALLRRDILETQKRVQEEEQ